MPASPTLVATLLTPVPGDAPAGKDLRYDPRYDRVKEARREDLALPEGGLPSDRKVADWPQVVTLASQLLGEETKDLQLAAWLTEALLKREGVGGLTSGLALLKGLLDTFWESLYPEYDEDDLELRAGPLEWVGSRLALPVRQTAIATGGVSLLDYQSSRSIPSEEAGRGSDEQQAIRTEAAEQGKVMPEVVDRAIEGTGKAFYKALVADVDAAAKALDALEVSADDRFGRDAPAFGQLRKALEELRLVSGTILADKLLADPDPVEDIPLDETAAEAAGDAAVAGGPLPAEPTSAADAASRIGVAARYLRKQDPANPAPYLMLRGLRWGELRTNGQSPDPKLLDAPPTAVRVRVKGLLLDGKWSELLEQCETVMATPQGRGWLDLQRYVLAACAQLGYDAVATAVRSELRTLLAAVPRLREMTLMDDTPTANAETQDWLDAQGVADGDGTEQDSAATVDAELGDQTAALDAALGEEDATSEHGGLRAGARRRRGSSGAASSHAAADPFTVARGELAQGRPNRAIELLLAELSRERSPRGRFVRQTQIAFVMVEAGHYRVAQPILERLVAVVDERKLEEWEAGPLVAQPMALLCRVLDRGEGGESTFSRTDLYLRVCRLDPLQALALQPA